MDPVCVARHERCHLNVSTSQMPQETQGLWVGDVFWLKTEESDPSVCLSIYYTHSQALAACTAKGPGWKLPSIAQANAFLGALSSEQRETWLPLVGNGGFGCGQTQTGLNAIWWLEEHNGASGGAALFCNEAYGCYTTGTQMGEMWKYLVRCVRTGCDSSRCPELGQSEGRLPCCQGLRCVAQNDGYAECQSA